MKKTHKKLACLVLAGLMIFQTAPGLISEGAKGISAATNAVQNLVVTKSAVKNGLVTATTASAAEAISAIKPDKTDWELIAKEGEQVHITGVLATNSNATASNAFLKLSQEDRNNLLKVDFDPDELALVSKNVTVSGGVFKFQVNMKAADLSIDQPTTYDVALSINDNLNVTADVTVTVKPDDAIAGDAVTAVEFLDKEVEMYVGESLALEYEVLPDTATDKSVKFSLASGSDAVVSVDAQGVVKANAVGKAEVTVTSVDDPSKFDTCVVSVLEEIEEEDFLEITLVPGTAKLNIGDTAVIDAFIGWGGKFSPSVTEWTVSAEGVIDIIGKDDTFAEIAAIDAGSVTLTATIYDEKSGEEVRSASCVILVVDEDKPLTPEVEKLDELIDKYLEKLQEAAEDPEAAKAVVKDMIEDLAKVEFSEETMLNEDVADRIVFIEKMIADNGRYGETECVIDADLFIGQPLGAMLNLPADAPTGTKAVLEVKNAELQPNETLPSGYLFKNTKIFDFSMFAVYGNMKDNMNEFRFPVRVAIEAPADMNLSKLAIYHFHNGERTKLDYSYNPDTNEITLILTRLSTIVMAEETRTSSGGSGGSGGSGSGISNSVPNLSGVWVQDAVGWWFKLNNGGYPANQWGKINNKWYYFNTQGYMMTGWVQLSGKWYYLQPTGEMVGSDWVFVNGKWYFLSSDGSMMAGQWYQHKGQWYYLNADGSMAVNTTTADGYAVNAEGVWIQ